jgi:hypothetical protein
VVTDQEKGSPLSEEKTWGSEPYWGLGYDWDPDWMLTGRQKELRATLIELCQQEMRDNAKRSGDELKFPRRNLELLGEHGFLALTVPEEYGGLGQNHVAYSMVCERAIANETKKLDAKGKRALADKLLAQAAEDEAKEPIPR